MVAPTLIMVANGTLYGFLLLIGYSLHHATHTLVESLVWFLGYRPFV